MLLLPLPLSWRRRLSCLLSVLLAIFLHFTVGALKALEESFSFFSFSLFSSSFLMVLSHFFFLLFFFPFSNSLKWWDFLPPVDRLVTLSLSSSSSPPWPTTCDPLSLLSFSTSLALFPLLLLLLLSLLEALVALIFFSFSFSVSQSKPMLEIEIASFQSNLFCPFFQQEVSRIIGARERGKSLTGDKKEKKNVARVGLGEKNDEGEANARPTDRHNQI